MSFFDKIVEARIKDAIERGELDDTPGKGQPLDLSELERVPEELRPMWFVLKEAGYVPEELQLRKEITSLSAILRGCEGEEQGHATRKELRRLETRYALLCEQRGVRPDPELLARLSGGGESGA